MTTPASQTLPPEAIKRSSLGPDVPALGRALVRAGFIKEQDAINAATRRRQSKATYVQEILNLGAIQPAQLASALSNEFGVPLVDLDSVNENKSPRDAIKMQLIQSLLVVPLALRGRKLTLGVVDPTDDDAREKVRFQTGFNVEVVLVEFQKLGSFIRRLDPSQETTSLDVINAASGDFDMAQLEDAESITPEQQFNDEAGDAPVVKFLQKMLVDAVQMGASDIHFEPFDNFYRVRFRVDGELREIVQPPLAVRDRLVSRVKVISKLDISEKRVPQDGRLRLRLSPTKSVDFRINTLPTMYGEKVVMRILDSSMAKLGIDHLGYEPAEKQRLLDAVARPYGMVLVTGPTGSGKTVSLYACLNLLNKPGVNVSTVEDPAEINLPGVNQVNINEKVGLTFGSALRALLRQDPDVVMIGEIRDTETAEIAVKAAQTGHMVLSTLHTNDAPSTITRLRVMGIPSYMLASSVLLITAQRLARRLCKECATPNPLPEHVLLEAGFKKADLGNWVPYKPVGCDHCHGSGYKGRLGIYEAMPITPAIQELILDPNSTELMIEKQARLDGVRSLRQSGLVKVKSGLTSLEEVLALTND